MTCSRRGLWKRDTLIGNVEDSETLGHIRYSPSKNQSKRSVDQSERWWIRIPNRRWYSKIVRERLRIPSAHSKAGTTCKERRSQWRISRRIGRVSTGWTNRWRWSPWRFLVDSRWLHLSSSHWTTSSTLCAEGRNISHSTEIRWCYQVYPCWSGWVTREEDWWLLECRFEQAFVGLLEVIHEIHSIEKETSKRISVVREETDKDSNDYQTRLCIARSMDEDR